MAGVTAKGETTRTRLLETAERLFAERGVDAVSLREIRLAAGLKHSGAMQYHFGDREGLMDAIAERHLPRIDERQVAMYAALRAAGKTEDVPALAEVLLRPFAEYTDVGPSERAWVRLGLDLMTHPEMGSLRELGDAASTGARSAGIHLVSLLMERMPVELAVERVYANAQAGYHIIADRARLIDAAETERPLLATDLFIENLIDMCSAGLKAPIGRRTRRLLDT